MLYQQFKRHTSFTWQRKRNLRLITSTPLNSSDIVMKGGSLTSGNKYRLALCYNHRRFKGNGCIRLFYGNTPYIYTGQLLDHSAASHWRLISVWAVATGKVTTPLCPYQFQYRLENGLYNALYRDVNNNISTSLIPPRINANNFVVKFIATVTDNFGTSASPVSLTVQVVR